jgi:hypothetical protein
MGPKHGVARGTAVYGSASADDPDVLATLMSRCELLRVWSLEHGVQLDDDPESLALVDGHLDAWNADASHHGNVDLVNEVGAYLGSVIVAHVAGSTWAVWPNGHPVVRLLTGRDLDVIELVGQRTRHLGSNLASVFASARGVEE